MGYGSKDDMDHYYAHKNSHVHDEETYDYDEEEDAPYLRRIDLDHLTGTDNSKMDF